MTETDSKNNYQNVIIILICFGLHIGLSNYLYTFAKNLELVLSMRFISNCIANLLITSPIWVGNALLNDGKSYWQRLGLGSNIKKIPITDKISCNSRSIENICINLK